MISLLFQSPRSSIVRITEVGRLSFHVRFIRQRFPGGADAGVGGAQHLARLWRNFCNKPCTYDAIHDYNNISKNNEKSILICGDGDLSFGASLSSGLLQSRPGVKLVASVLESQDQHNGGMSSLDNE